MDDDDLKIMPYGLTPTALARDKSIKHTATNVYIILASNLNPETGTAWCAVGRIEAALGLHRRNVSKALKQLKDAGYIQVLQQGGGKRKENGRGRASLYRIVPHTELGPEIISGDDVDEPPQDTPDETNIISGDDVRSSQESQNTPSMSSHEMMKYRPLKENKGRGAAEGGEKDGPSGPPLPEDTAPDGRPRAGKDGANAPPQRPPNGARGAGALAGSARSAKADLVERFSGTSKPEGASEAYARSKIAEYIGVHNGAWEILMAADDPDSPGHETALKRVQSVADEIGVRWPPPKREAAE